MHANIISHSSTDVAASLLSAHHIFPFSTFLLTAMISWEVFRGLAASIQDSLWSVTDDVLGSCMQETPEFAMRYAAASAELAEMNKAIDIFESIG